MDIKLVFQKLITRDKIDTIDVLVCNTNNNGYRDKSLRAI